VPVANNTAEPPTLETHTAVVPPVKPRLRGVLHLIAFGVSLVTGPALVAAAPRGGPTLAVAIYATSMSALFGVSALLHRRTWTPEARRIMRRLDHSMIFFLIAGTYTAIAPLALGGTVAAVILAIVWIGGAIGVVIELFWLEAPKWAIALPYVVVGWTAVGAIPQLGSAVGGAGLGLLVGGGLAYTAGAAIYALRWPNPWPSLFGYHEVFHGLTIVAGAAHYVLIARYVLPLA
jgi:hemolysin III